MQIKKEQLHPSHPFIYLFMLCPTGEMLVPFPSEKTSIWMKGSLPSLALAYAYT